MKVISSFIKFVGTFLLLGLSAYVFVQSYNKYENPCALPLTYKIDSFDTRFNLSEEEFLSAVHSAENAWESKTGLNLFEEDKTNGILSLNLIYDDRQLATTKLDALDTTIENSKESYDSLQARYAKQLTSYNQAVVEYDQNKAVYEARRESYQNEVSYWNNHGGAPDNEYKKLSQEKDVLSALQITLDKERQELNTLADDTNALADRLNVLAKSLNKNISQYNAVGKTVATEFDQGLFERDEKGERINVYQFDTTPALVHVLTHEFGHALNLEHSDNQNSIMYYLHQKNVQAVTDEDVAALKTACKI